jgi:hypothetical protein
MIFKDAKALNGKFILIRANGSQEPKEIHGWVRDYDRQNICVIDNEDWPHIFRLEDVKHIEEEEFKPQKREE